MLEMILAFFSIHFAPTKLCERKAYSEQNRLSKYHFLDIFSPSPFLKPRHEATEINFYVFSFYE